MDSSFNAVFRALPAAAADANKKVTADAKASANAQSAILKNQLDLTKKNFQELIRETGKVHDQGRKLEAASHEARLKLRLEAAKKATAIEIAEATARAKATAQIEIVQAKEAARQIRIASAGGSGGAGGGRGGRDMAYRMGYWASRNLSPVTPMLSFAGRMGHDILSGTGVDFNVGGMVAGQFELQKRLTELSNQGYQEGKAGPRGKRVDVSTLDAETRNVGKTYGFDYNEVAKATTKFVDLTGNLDQARASMAGLARLSNATATDLTDMSSAAAAVAVQLDRAMGSDTQGKAGALQNIMRSFAGLGKEGAVEIKDLAPQMAKIAVMAPKFAGGVESVFADLGVLAQESRKAGGSASASQAATSIARFGDLMINPKTQKAFVKQMTAVGMQPETLFADKEKTKLRPIEEIILTSLQATKGSLPALQGLFKNVMANRAIQGFANVYNQTQGTEKEKLEAVHEEYQSLKKATVSAKEEEENNARVMATAAKKAQVFQDKLQDVVSEMADKVIPTFEKLGPAALDVMTGFTKMTGWLAENPAAIIPVAIGAAFTKALAEQTVRAGVESVVRDVSGKAGPGFGGGAGVLGNAAAAFTIASLAVATFMVGKMYVDSMMEKKDQALKNSIETELDAGNVESVLARQIRTGKVDDKTIGTARDAAKRTEEAIAKEKGGRTPGMDRFMSNIGFADDVRKTQHIHDERLHALMETLVRLNQQIAQGVRIKELPPGSPPPFLARPGGAGDGVPPLLRRQGDGTSNTGAANP